MYKHKINSAHHSHPYQPAPSASRRVSACLCMWLRPPEAPLHPYLQSLLRDIQVLIHFQKCIKNPHLLMKLRLFLKIKDFQSPLIPLEPVYTILRSLKNGKLVSQLVKKYSFQTGVFRESKT